MKRKIIITFMIIIFIVVLLITFMINFQKSNKTNADISNNEQLKENVELENNITSMENSTLDEKNIIDDSNNSLPNTQINTNDTSMNSLPNDVGLTINGVHKTYNQDIISQANIAYMLGCENISDTTNFEDYISKNSPKNGIYISKVTGYKKTNPYDFVRENTDTMKEKLSKINMTYDIDKNNYLVNNNGTSELEQKLNKLILGDKKIIIGFVPEYYVYINDVENGLGFGGFSNSSYVSLKPYNNIYTFIFDFNSENTDEFYQMLEEIAKLAE